MDMAKKKLEAAIALVESWLGDTSGYDKKVWVKLSLAIEREMKQKRLCSVCKRPGRLGQCSCNSLAHHEKCCLHSGWNLVKPRK